MQMSLKDWVLAVLLAATIVLGFVCYNLHQNINSLRMSDSSFAQSSAQSEAQIQELKSCIDHNTKPCGLSNY